MKSWLLNNWLPVAGVLTGAAAGFVYWKLVGCRTGTCAITSVWYNSTAYGGLMGGLLFSIFKKSSGPGGAKQE